MFYRHWNKIALTLTAFFWASCTSENAAQPLYGVYCPPEGCGEPELSSSGKIPVSSSSEVASSSNSVESSSSENTAESSSSIATQQSSSSVNPNLYRLASDPSVTCTQSNINGGKCLDEEDAKSSKEAIQRKIDEYKKTVEENQTLTLEQLDALEEKTIADLKKWIDADYNAFRTPKTHCTHVDLGTPIYKCSNNETYDATTLVTDYTEKLIQFQHRAKLQRQCNVPFPALPKK